MCPFHHKVIDDDPTSYTVSRLKEIKKSHQKDYSESHEPSDDVASQFILNISNEAVISTHYQKGGQVAHSIINISYEENTRLIQALFNRIVLFIQSLIENNASDTLIPSIIKSFDNSDLRNIFGIEISKARRGLDNTIELLNGRYTLRIEIHIEGVKYSLFKDKVQIDLINQIERFKFFEDLQNFSALTTGFEPVLPNDIKKQKDRIIGLNKNFNILTRMFEKLYKTGAKFSHNFVEIIHRSEEIRDNFGISAPMPTQSGIPIDDVEIHFLDGHYRLIPNSASLSSENERGQYEKSLHKLSPPELVENSLNQFFKDIVTYVKTEHKIELNFRRILFLNEKDVEKGYCVRCGMKIEFNHAKPYCYDCFLVWAGYNNPEFQEDYCHQCGKYYKTTIYKPLCNKCYWND